MAEPSRERKRRRLNYNKCRFCRTAKKACTPVERTWPEKCQRCTELELDCSENTRAAGASTPIAAQHSNEIIDIQTIRNLSLGVACIARLKSYINAIEIVWDTQDKLFSGWRNSVRVPPGHEIIEPKEALLLNKFSSEMLISNHPLAAVMVHAVMTGPSLLQRCPPDRPFVAVAELVDYFRENSDVGTALAIQEILLLPWSTSDTLPTNAARLLKYCELYLETTDRLEAILEDGVSFMPPPLHYFLLLAKEKNLSLPITPVHSHLISMKDYFGRSLLHMTLDLGIMANVLPLIKLGVSTDTGDNLGRRPIHIACSVNSEAEVLQYILEHTVNCEVEDSLGRSALHYASSCGNESAIQLLLERGASIHHQDQDGKLPILWAVKHGHSAAVDLLLRNGATAKSLDRHGGMLLSIAVENRYTDIIQSLVRYGANTNTENAYDKTALHAAAERGHTTTTETLIRNGANIDINAQIALHTAAKRGHIATVEALIRNGANIDIRDSYSKTALHAAANRGHIATIEALIRNGANIGIRDLLGRTALHDAVSSRHVDTIKILLNNGADINLLSCNQTDRLIQLLAADTPNA